MIRITLTSELATLNVVPKIYILGKSKYSICAIKICETFSIVWKLCAFRQRSNFCNFPQFFIMLMVSSEISIRTWTIFKTFFMYNNHQYWAKHFRFFLIHLKFSDFVHSDDCIVKLTSKFVGWPVFFFKSQFWFKEMRNFGTIFLVQSEFKKLASFGSNLKRKTANT